jgi:hypothetical protein
MRARGVNRVFTSSPFALAFRLPTSFHLNLHFYMHMHQTFALVSVFYIFAVCLFCRFLAYALHKAENRSDNLGSVSLNAASIRIYLRLHQRHLIVLVRWPPKRSFQAHACKMR